MKRRFLVLAMALLVVTAERSRAIEPKVELLWPHGAPGAMGDRPTDKPTLTIFQSEAERAVGTAVVLCPGGGYGSVSVDLEGYPIARWLNSLGVTAFMLEYRNRRGGYGHPAPLQDAQRAIRTVRARAGEWNIAPDRIGIMGFSAGGHLASTVGTHFDKGDPAASDPIDRIGCRPDFLILCYAVVAFGEPYTNRGSQKNLLGTNPDPSLVRSLSNEKQVTAETPPTFLFLTDSDKVVPAENSVQFYLALRGASVPAEMHIYQSGCHALGLAAGVPGTASWSEHLKDWMQVRQLLNVSPQARTSRD